MRRITETLPFCPSSGAPSQALPECLNQPFRFFGMGSECFAFLSQDGQTVLKFFKLDHFRFVYLKKALSALDYAPFADARWSSPLWRLPSWCDPLRKRLIGVRIFRIQHSFQSCQLAQKELAEQTGLLYLHLTPTRTLHKQLTLIDPLGMAHPIDLDSSYFVLQKRATLVKPALRALRRTGDLQTAHTLLKSLFQLICLRYQKGIYDRDALIMQNFGFLGHQAVEIDLGSFSQTPYVQSTAQMHQELLYVTKPLRRWLQSKWPELLPIFDAEILLL